MAKSSAKMKAMFKRINQENLPQWKASLRELESYFTYPLGQDFFSIDHGENYLAFFQRMGKAHFYSCIEDKKIIAVAAGVIHHRFKAWYLCDMKVHPDHRGNRLTLKLFRKYFIPCYLQSQKGFALTMESTVGRQNPIIKIMESLPWTPLRLGTRLFFFYENKDTTDKALTVFQNTRPEIKFSSLAGIKDLVLKSTNKPIPLLHMEWGKTQNGTFFPAPQEGFLHMWCLKEHDPLLTDLFEMGITPKASGFIFHHRLGHIDWNELRTSEL
jgi:hypothetical protein